MVEPGLSHWWTFKQGWLGRWQPAGYMGILPIYLVNTFLLSACCHLDSVPFTSCFLTKPCFVSSLSLYVDSVDIVYICCYKDKPAPLLAIPIGDALWDCQCSFFFFFLFFSATILSGPYLWNHHSQRLQIECAAWSCGVVLHYCLPSNSLRYFFFF